MMNVYYLTISEEYPNEEDGKKMDDGRWTKKSENVKKFRFLQDREPNHMQKKSRFGRQNCESFVLLRRTRRTLLSTTTKNEKNTFTERTRATAERVVLF